MKRARITMAALIACATGIASLPQVWADPGDVVIVRKVEPRSAFREGSGPVVSKVNAAQDVTSMPSLDASGGRLVQHELSSGEFASVVSGIPQGAAAAAVGGGQQPGMLESGGPRMASYGVSAGATVNSALTGGGSAAGAVTRQATDQLVGALRGAGLMGR